MSPTPPPPQPITNTKIHCINRFHKPTSLPDLFLTAISLLLLFSSPKATAIHFPKIPFLSFQLNPRRLVKIPIMSHPPAPNKILHRFATPQSLSDWLKPRLPSDSFASWGVKPGTKNVHNLWLELSEGETSLADSTPPIRTVNVVSVRIISVDNGILVESHQELSDGSVRDRCRPLSEKMKPNESPEEAVVRAVKEELGSIMQLEGGSLPVVRIVAGSYEKKLEERNSVSYPGLPARYVLHSLDAFVEGLPDDDFCTEETEDYGDSHEYMAANKAVSVKRHYWKWVRF
ncbi:hypothetical protein CFOL_v3_16748 [Cephalotus follicularis]|uniref:NUDIX domain-containing protein n=1 Tax=Cephalotus follicularis TaxID=3775 RepID=A0A1Q3BZD6_CEPFO|nr:hypothetical protein CFOL_v3_16748 [Cephalotus follicularis]